MNDILEMAQGNLTRVIAVRLRPGTDVLAWADGGLPPRQYQQRRDPQRHRQPGRRGLLQPPWSCPTRRPATAMARSCT